MRVAASITLSLAFLAGTAIAQDIDYDWPDASQKLNLSAPISFNYELRRENSQTQLDFSFHYQLHDSDDGNLYSTSIFEDRGLNGSKGTFSWDPSGLLASLEEDGRSLRDSQVHYFQAYRHEKNSAVGSTQESPKYKVEAVEDVVGSSANMEQPWVRIALLGLGIASLGFL